MGCGAAGQLSAASPATPAVAAPLPVKRKTLGGMDETPPELDMSELLARIGRTRDVKQLENVTAIFANLREAFATIASDPKLARSPAA